MFFSEQILIFLLVLVTVAFVMKWMRKKDSSVYRHPPSLPCLPLVGSLPFLRRPDEVFTFFHEKSTELGPIYTLRVGRKLVLTLNTKDAIEKAYVKNSTGFSDRPPLLLEGLVNPEYKGIIFVTNSAKWKKQQQLSLSVLREFGFGVKSIMETRISKEVEAIVDFVKSKKGEPFDPTEMCTLAASNIIFNILFGRRRDYDMGQSKLSEQVYYWGSNSTLVFDVAPFLCYVPSHRKQIDFYDKTVKGIFKLVESEIAECLRNTDVPCFVISYIQKAGEDYEPDQLTYLVRDLIGAASDTSTTSLLWWFVALANNPDVQKRMHAEIDAVIPRDRLPTLQDEADLPYVQAAILEVNRWRTLVPMSVLRETSRDVVIDGYFIPGRTMVIANLYAAHNDISVWKDPEVFRPERFLDSENNVIGKEKIVPFSIGRRSCLGEAMARAQLFLIFTSIVQRFIVLPPEGQDRISEGHTLPVAIVLHPEEYKIRLIERK